MLHIKNPKQMELFDPWAYLGPKRRKRLDQSWAGFFRNDILPVLPVASMAPFFSESFGRPSKELHTILGVLLLQQMLNLTDDETLDQLSYSIQWHYALNITEETDSAKYFCPKTLWNVRNIASTHNVDSKLFETITDSLVKKFEVDTDYQRLDSVHLKSNMRRLGRISIISNTIHKFLVNLKRQNPDAFGSVSTVLVERYVTPKAMVCFSRVKPSDSDKTLQSVSQNLYELEQQFKGDADVSKMHSYKLLERVFKEQCSVKTTDNGKVIEVVPQKPHDVPCDSVQNPSDPDASYCAHKGQGFKAQIMETFSPDKDNEKEGGKLRLITHVEVEKASHSDAHAVIPAISSTSKRNLAPKEIQADTLYGGDANWKAAKENGVNLVSPVKDAPRSMASTLSSFSFNDDGHVASCPQGVKPQWSKKKKARYIQGFCSDTCSVCPHKEGCPVKPGKNNHYLRYDDRTFRLARRKAFEKTDQFLEKYRWRAGVEATMSELDRRTGAKKLRVRGFSAVRFAVVLKVIGVNIFRAAALIKDLFSPNRHDSRCTFSIFDPFVFFKERKTKNNNNYLQNRINNYIYYNYVFN